MRERAPGARALGAARLVGWRLTFSADSPDDGFGVPHIEPDAADEVWGVLWELTANDLAALDDYEGSAYTRGDVVVSHDDLDVEAVVYFAKPTGYVNPSTAFMKQLVRGAEAHGLPPEYVERLKRFP
jgi:gamma-glutamylcyclotransferase (GGCT)/AIG2-like uncharacterized protein YtfP